MSQAFNGTISFSEAFDLIIYFIVVLLNQEDNL
jgi:hypothetical protein